MAKEIKIKINSSAGLKAVSAANDALVQMARASGTTNKTMAAAAQ